MQSLEQLINITFKTLPTEPRNFLIKEEQQRFEFQWNLMFFHRMEIVTRPFGGTGLSLLLVEWKAE